MKNKLCDGCKFEDLKFQCVQNGAIWPDYEYDADAPFQLLLAPCVICTRLEKKDYFEKKV